MATQTQLDMHVSRPRRSLLRLALVGAALVAGGAISGGLAPAAMAADCNQTIFDGSGYRYDFVARDRAPGGFEYGSPKDGGSESPPAAAATREAWDSWGDVFVFSPGAEIEKPTLADEYIGPTDACGFGLNGQEIAYPIVPMHGLEAQHRWFVDPGPLHGARILTVLHNPGAMPTTVTIAQGDPSGFDDLGSDNTTASRATSDGTNVFSPASSWGVTSDSASLNDDPALAHVWDGIGGTRRADLVVLGTGFTDEDTLFWAWENVTVQPGATVAFISYEIQSVDASRAAATEVAQAVAQAQSRATQPPSSLYAGMSTGEIAGTLNWPHPGPTATIAPIKNANAARPVNLNGSLSVGAAGLPQCSLTSFAWKAERGVTGSGPRLSHLFPAGKHEATLTVSNDCGGSQSATVRFDVAKGFQLGKLELNRKAGTAKLRVKVRGPGKLMLKGKGVRKQAKSVKRAGNVSLLVKPTGKAAAALARTGEAKLKVTVALKPKGGKADRQAKAITLKTRS